MKLFKIATLSTALMALPLAAAADVPNTFQAGQPASAAEVNQNFSALDQRISDLEAQAGTTLSMESLSGDYQMHLTGSLWNYFNEQTDPATTEAMSFRDFLVAGTLTLNGDGTMSYSHEALEPGIVMSQSGFFEDDTVGGPETVSGTWSLDSANNIVSVTIDPDTDPFTLDFHIARDQNSLLGSKFIQNTFTNEFNEEVTEYEVINLNAIRLP